MSKQFSNATVTYNFIDPSNPKAPKKHHSVQYLKEDYDEAQLKVIGEQFQKLAPTMTLSQIIVSTDHIIQPDAATDEHDNA